MQTKITDEDLLELEKSLEQGSGAKEVSSLKLDKLN